MNNPHIVLACLSNGEHVQVGRMLAHDAAHALYARLDSELTGFYRSAYGFLRYDARRARPQFIDGQAVKFYRVRQVPNEFGNVRQFPVRAIQKEASMKRNVKTPAGIVRPKRGTYARFIDARSAARKLNETKGRGYRALKAQDGNAEVIFRPAVAGNKQRKVRALGTAV